MFGWIPVIGPIISGIFNLLNKKQDAALEKYKEDSKVDIETIKAYTQVILATKDDPGIRLSRDLVIFPVAIWTSLISWDTIVALRYPSLMFHVAPFPETVAYLPGAVLAFLLGNIGMNVWRNK